MTHYEINGTTRLLGQQTPVVFLDDQARHSFQDLTTAYRMVYGCDAQTEAFDKASIDYLMLGVIIGKRIERRRRKSNG